MVAAVKAIQLITGEFEFNSYIISVLVIFFLQINYGLPTTMNLESTYTKITKEWSHLIFEFFKFYSTSYLNKGHIISARFGRWQQLKWNPADPMLDDEQRK